MLLYIAKRILIIIPTIFIITIITFIIIQLPPGDFFTTMQAEVAQTGGGPDRETVELMQERYGLNEPLPQQYWKWVSGFPRGDFGYSFDWGSDVLPLVVDRLAYTILVGTLSLVFMFVVAVPIGIYAAQHQYSIGDNLLSFIGFLGLSIPGFLLALLWMYLGIVILNIDVGGVQSPEYFDQPWSISSFLDALNHLWPPVVILGLASTAQIQRIMRSNMLDELGKQYVTTARSKGLPEQKVVNRYAVRVALNPVISVMAMEVPKIISESAIIGIVMSIPTTGPLLLRALLSQDMFLAGTILMFMAFMLLIANLIADILLAWLDPRIIYD